jgi:biopolymer transport protein ExbD
MTLIQKNLVAVEALSSVVKKLIEPGKDLVVVLNADGSITHDRVVEVMDQIRQVPYAKMAIATKRR